MPGYAKNDTGALRVDEHEVPQSLQLRDRELGEIPEPLDGGQARAALQARRERLAQQLGAGRLPRCGSRRAARRSLQRAAAEQQRGRLAASAAPWPRARSSSAGHLEHRAHRPRSVRAPRPRTTTRRPAGSASRRRRASAATIASVASRPTSAAVVRRTDPPRHVARHALDVGRERRVERLVIRRVVADDVDDRRARPARVVQVGETVAETGTEVQQRRRRAGRPCGRSRRPRRWRRLRTA